MNSSTSTSMFLLLLAFCVLAGCHSEDYSFCPPEVRPDNVTLEFRLLNGDIFTEHVSSVLVAIFDAGDNLVETVTLTEDVLRERAGVVLTLIPGGVYRLVFWANVGEKTAIDVMGPSGRVTYSEFSSTVPRVVGSCDGVWYAPCVALPTGTPMDFYDLRVPKGVDYSDVIYFTHAHRSMEVYIHGLRPDPEGLPTVEITGLLPGLGFYGMKGLEEPLVTASVPTGVVTREGIVYAAAGLNVFRFPDEMVGIDIVIRDARGNELYRIPLAEAVERCGEDPQNIVLKFVFGFMEGSIEVNVPNWNSNETGIGFVK